jgi:ubiquinone/menaquinone biosynthesis C-methylase UbiE
VKWKHLSGERIRPAQRRETSGANTPGMTFCLENKNGSLFMSAPRERFEDTDLFRTWDDDYYRSYFLSFYDSVIEYVIEKTGIKEGDEILEAGCGPCVHTIRMAKKGLKCISVDFSAAVLEEGKARLSKEGLLDQVTLKQEDLTNLSFPDNSFSYIFCWGVIMHIPEPEKAIKELSRVLKPGGYLAISNNNANSLDKLLMEKIAYRFKRPKSLIKLGTSDLGRYAVFRDNNEDLFVQSLFPKKIAASFASNGLQLESCVGTQFTELYTQFRSDFIRRIFSTINKFWFRHIRHPHLCAEHLLILRKN